MHCIQERHSEKTMTDMNSSIRMLQGKKCHLYARTLEELRKKKEDTFGIMRTTSQTYLSGNITLNEAFDYYMLGKRNLKNSTRDNGP